MPRQWFRHAQKSGHLTVFNKGGAWSHEVETARTTFNSLGFPVTLDKADDEKNANIVVKLAMGPDSQKSWGKTASTRTDFDPKVLHGSTATLVEEHDKPKKTFEVIFAAIFLPGKVQATSKQKEVIVVHEYIHACGLNGGRPDGSNDDIGQDHDDNGIFVAQVKKDGDGLIEYMPDKGAVAMPPIRIGGHTRCKIQSIWGTEACKED